LPLGCRELPRNSRTAWLSLDSTKPPALTIENLSKFFPDGIILSRFYD
jgi:hypothetical protein